MSVWDWDDAARQRLADFLEKKQITKGPVSTKIIGDGHSNLTFLVTDESGFQVVVRRPPPPPTPPGAHDMMREARLISALGKTPVPVAECLAIAEAGEVIDVHFYVMSFARGPVVTTHMPASLAAPDVCRKVGFALIDTLVDLHKTNWQDLGLADIGKPKGFNRRHLNSMGRLVADNSGQPPPEFQAITRWLEANVPDESGATLIHNDFRIGNVVLDTETPGTIEAVLDWELATIGDPLFDVGYFLVSIPDIYAGQPQEGLTPTEKLGVAMLAEGFPSKAELAAHYVSRTGADISNLQWYKALVNWKLAAFYEYGRRRAVNGVGDPYFGEAGMVYAFLNAAHKTAGLAPLKPPIPPAINKDQP